MENNQPLTIESDVFTELRNAINVMLKNTLEKMISKDGDQAELKVSLKITLVKNAAPDSDPQSFQPMFEHKVSSILQYKNELSGFLNCAGFEMVWDPGEMEYVMRPVEGGLFKND